MNTNFNARLDRFETFPLEGETTLGRDPRCTIVLTDPRVSRVHAIVEPSGDGWKLVDRSSNGMLINGETFPRVARLRPNDRIQIQDYLVFFRPGFLLVHRPEEGRLSA